MCFTVLSGIYANISLFLSYSKVTIATQIQSVSRSDGGPAPRDDLDSSECQRRPRTARWAPETDPLQRPRWPLGQDHENQTNPLQNLTCAGIKPRHAGFIWTEENCPPDCAWLLPRFSTQFLSRWSFGSLPLSPLACLFGDSWLIAQTLLEESWTGWCHHWITNELTLTGKMTCYCPLALLTNYFPVWLC